MRRPKHFNCLHTGIYFYTLYNLCAYCLMEISCYNISIKPYFSILIINFLYNCTFRHFAEICESSLIPPNLIQAWNDKILFFFLCVQIALYILFLRPGRRNRVRALSRFDLCETTTIIVRACVQHPGFSKFVSTSFFRRLSKSKDIRHARTRHHSVVIKTSDSDGISLLSVSALPLRRDPGPDDNV